jgi:hypothetical protein
MKTKKTFKQELQDYKKRGGDLAFIFGDVHLPVTYREMLNLLSVNMPEGDVFINVDYNLDLIENLDILMDKLLDKYPHLED